MKGRIGRAMVALTLVGLLSACGGSGTPKLLNLANDGKPDEFGILPTKPLEAPTNMAALPPPTPGGANLTDPTPEADAVAALGGSPAALNRPQTAAETALLNHAGRYGIDGRIRPDLAAADLEWRRTHDSRLLERLFNLTTYYRAYRAMELDQYYELARLRRAGVKTPAAPPDPAR